MGCGPPAPTPRRSTSNPKVICPANSATEKIATPMVSTASAPATTMYAPPSPAESVHRGTGQDGNSRNVRLVPGRSISTTITTASAARKFTTAAMSALPTRSPRTALIFGWTAPSAPAPSAMATPTAARAATGDVR